MANNIDDNAAADGADGADAPKDDCEESWEYIEFLRDIR